MISMSRLSPPRSVMFTIVASGIASRQPLGPLHRHDSRRRQILIEADLIEVGAIEAIQIDVDRAAAGRRDTRGRA